ncbi:MAG: purine-binding chemotaxis protein CheW [Bacteroidetes bacterium]|nr:purine-binding chemotaxis protein CheW [Bacteroidota bacterium]
MENNQHTEELSLEQLKREVVMDVRKKDVGKRMQLIIFKLGTEEYALLIDQIKEVVITPRIAKMPQTANYIKGVANIRGNIIAILDLEEKFGIERNSSQGSLEANYTLVIESDEFKAGFLVKEVPNTLSIVSSDIEPADNFIQFTSIDENCIQGVVKSGDRLIILIDINKLMESTSVKQLINKI